MTVLSTSETIPAERLMTERAEASWETAEVCGLCGSRGFTERLRVNDKAYVECDGCQVIRLYHRIAATRLDLLYGDYYGAAQAQLAPTELAEQLANPTFARRRKRLERAVSSAPRKLFEIGCGDGNFLAYLRQHGWQVDGCEYGDNTYEFIRARHGIEITVGDFTTLGLPPASLDVIGAYAVLEHLYEPLPWLQQIRRTLKTGGLAHLQVPNLRCWDFRLTGECWSLLSFPEHVYFYHPAALRRLLEREGFEVLSVTTYDPWHGPGTVLSSARNLLKHRLTGWQPWRNPSVTSQTAAAQPAAAQKKMRSQMFNLAARPAAVAAARLQSWFGYGNNLDVVARTR